MSHLKPNNRNTGAYVRCACSLQLTRPISVTNLPYGIIMIRHLTAILTIMTSMLNAQAHAAQGEYWEVTNKMEIPGMPFAMPSTTNKVCIAKGAENDPKNTSGDKDCQMSDIKTTGNNVSWKARCVHDGEVMTGKGEQTTTTNGYAGKMQLSGKSGGEDVSMNMIYSGKRIGGACDPEEMVKKFNAQMCDTSRYESSAEWISSSDHIFSNCPDQRGKLCETVRRDASRDAYAYTLLLQHDHQPNTASIARECKLDMASTTSSICKGVNNDNYSMLAKHCPSEAKAFREAKRRKECEGRSYSGVVNAETIRACMEGGNRNADNSQPENPVSSGKPQSPSTGKPAAPSSAKTGNPPEDNPVNNLLEGVKTLKGMFGF